MKKILISGHLLAALVLSGCASNSNHGGYVQFYQGRPLPKDQTAVIKGHDKYRNGSADNDLIRIVEIDNKKIPGEFGVADGADSVAVVPGIYSVKLLYASAYSTVDFYAYRTLTIFAKAGCRYDVTANMNMQTRLVSFKVQSVAEFPPSTVPTLLNPALAARSPVLSGFGGGNSRY